MKNAAVLILTRMHENLSVASKGQRTPAPNLCVAAGYKTKQLSARFCYESLSLACSFCLISVKISNSAKFSARFDNLIC